MKLVSLLFALMTLVANCQVVLDNVNWNQTRPWQDWYYYNTKSN